MTDFMTCHAKDMLVSYLYDEVAPDERSAVEAHLVECADCRAEVEGLTTVRASLSAWESPPLRAHVRVVAEPLVKPAVWRRPWVAAPLAAAAVLVLAAAASLANLEIRYGADGLVLRTGWGSSQVTAARELRPSNALTPVSQTGSAPWRADLVSLEQQLRREFGSSRPAAPGSAPMATAVSSHANDDELLRRVQQLIDESEIRQQRNLALRMTEVSRDVSVQRQADLVQIQQGFGRLEGRTEQEAAKSRELMNYIMRVSQQEPPR